MNGHISMFSTIVSLENFDVPPLARSQHQSTFSIIFAFTWALWVMLSGLMKCLPASYMWFDKASDRPVHSTKTILDRGRLFSLSLESISLIRLAVARMDTLVGHWAGLLGNLIVGHSVQSIMLEHRGDLQWRSPLDFTGERQWPQLWEEVTLFLTSEAAPMHSVTLAFRLHRGASVATALGRRYTVSDQCGGPYDAFSDARLLTPPWSVSGQWSVPSVTLG
jgi:hypothetical protein